MNTYKPLSDIDLIQPWNDDATFATLLEQVRRANKLVEMLAAHHPYNDDLHREVAAALAAYRGECDG